MRLLSDLDPKVCWRLNDLLRAGQKALTQVARQLSDDAESMVAGAGEAFV